MLSSPPTGASQGRGWLRGLESATQPAQLPAALVVPQVRAAVRNLSLEQGRRSTCWRLLSVALLQMNLLAEAERRRRTRFGLKSTRLAEAQILPRGGRKAGQARQR